MPDSPLPLTADERWPGDRTVLRRLRAVLDAVPGPAGGTQSTTFAGIASYGRDMVALRQVIRRVLRAATTPRPHPEWGDDGDRADARSEALEALEWAERWAEWRNQDQWSSKTCAFGDAPWK